MRRAVGGQGVGLAAGAVEREHQLLVPTLTVGVLARVALERGDLRLGLEVILLCGDAQCLELGGGRIGALDRAAPERERGRPVAVADEPPERERVQFVLAGHDPVAAPARS